MAIGDNSAGILFRIKGDESDAVRAFKNTRQESNLLASSASGLGSALTGLINPATLVVAGITAIAAAATSATIAAFNLTKQTGEYGDQIFDTAQKTNVSTDAIQAWNFAAEQSGSTSDKVNVSLAKFSVLLGQAANGNEKAQKTLEKYNITATDTDEALQQAIVSIMKMTDVNQQNAAAAELFKDKGGDVINMIREMDGNLPGTIKKLREMGLMMSKEDVEAAAKFTDELDLLEKQLASVGRELGSAFMPVFRDMASSVSKFLKDNQGEIRQWGDQTAKTIQGLILHWNDLSKAAASYGITVKNINAVNPFYQLGKQVRESAIARANAEPVPVAGANAPPIDYSRPQDFKKKTAAELKEDKEAAEELRKEREKQAKQALQDLDTNIRLKLQVEREGFDAAQSDLEKNYIERNITEKSYLENSIENIKAYRSQVMELIRQGYMNDIKQATTDLQKANALIVGNRALANLNAEIKRENADIAKLIEKTNKDISEDQKKERKAALDHWEKARKAQIDAYDIQAEADKDKEEQRQKDIDHWNKRRKAQQDQMELEQQADRERDARRRAEIESQQVSNSPIGAGIAGSLGVDLVSIFGDQDQLKSQADFLKDIMNDVKTSVGDAVGSMIDGLADLAIQWIITGEFSAQAALKMAAGIALGVAKQALIKGMFEVAESIAAAARLDFASAALHAAAAKVYFVTAAIAGAAGIGLAFGARAAGGDGGSRSPSQANRNRDTERDLTPISKTSKNAFESGRPGYGPFAELSAAITDLHKKITSMKEGEVLARGISQRPGLIGNAYNNDASRNASIGTNTRRIIDGR